MSTGSANPTFAPPAVDLGRCGIEGEVLLLGDRRHLLGHCRDPVRFIEQLAEEASSDREGEGQTEGEVRGTGRGDRLVTGASGFIESPEMPRRDGLPCQGRAPEMEADERRQPVVPGGFVTVDGHRQLLVGLHDPSDHQQHPAQLHPGNRLDRLGSQLAGQVEQLLGPGEGFAVVAA